MHFFYEIFHSFFSQVSPETSIVLSLVAFLGYLLLGYSFSESIKGAFKTALGVTIMQYGSHFMSATFHPLSLEVSKVYGIDVFVGDPYVGYPAVVDALGKNMVWAGYAVFIGFLWNVLLVKLRSWTRIRSLFLTGHIMYLQASFVVWLVHNQLNSEMIETIFISGLLCGTYWAVGSNLILDATNKVTDGADFTIGHQQMIGSWLATKTAPLLGNPKDSIENFKVPVFRRRLNTNIVAPSIMMTATFAVVSIFLGGDILTRVTGGTNIWINLIFLGVSFALSLTLILTGVRMFIGELSVSFRGISERLLPGAVIAVDCAALYGFSPYAMFFGFIMGALGQFIALGILIFFKAPILIVPGFIPVFFDNATIGIYANKFGGWKALFIICLTSGIIQIIGGSWAASLSGLEYGWMGNFDWIAVWPGLMIIVNNFHIFGLIMVILGGILLSRINDRSLHGKGLMNPSL